jgi:APA family basic amino acid/polyamine antiporter
MAEILIYAKNPEKFSARRFGAATVLALGAFVYSLWAVIGAGAEIVYWGFVLLMAGVPVYVWIRTRK